MLATIITTAPDQYQVMLNNYVNILEKTNQQLGLWSNPYGIMIGILTFLLTICAIVVSIYIWKNSKEQKDLFKNSILENQKNLEKQASLFIEQKKVEMDKVIADFEKLKESVTEEKKAELEKTIDEYKKEKEKIYNEPVSIHYDNNNIYGVSSALSMNPVKSTHCTNCGIFFKYKDDTNYLTTISLANLYGQKKVYCPKCNTENFV